MSIRCVRYTTGLLVSIAALLLTSCGDDRNYSRVYAYRPMSTGEMAAFISGGYLRNTSGFTTGGLNSRMGYAHVSAIDGAVMPRGDLPTQEEKFSYSFGGFLLGQEMTFKPYPISPGYHRISTEITMMGQTQTYEFTFLAQPAGHYRIVGEGGGMNARVWLIDQMGRPVVGILDSAPRQFEGPGSSNPQSQMFRGPLRR